MPLQKTNSQSHLTLRVSLAGVRSDECLDFSTIRSIHKNLLRHNRLRLTSWHSGKSFFAVRFC